MQCVYIYMTLSWKEWDGSEISFCGSIGGCSYLHANGEQNHSRLIIIHQLVSKLGVRVRFTSNFTSKLENYQGCQTAYDEAYRELQGR
jgi:hypothetical protein